MENRKSDKRANEENHLYSKDGLGLLPLIRRVLDWCARQEYLCWYGFYQTFYTSFYNNCLFREQKYYRRGISRTTI